MKTIKLCISTILCLWSITSLANEMKVLAQAGSISEGKPFVFYQHPGEIASYYKDGTSGQVKFNCVFIGDKAKAMLYPGKNFEGNSVAVLQVGNNGPYTWTLRNTGEKNGNIKVQLLEGQSAVVQCKEIN